EFPAVFLAEVDLEIGRGVLGNGEVALFVSAVGPEGRVNRVRNHARLHGVVLYAREEAAFTEFARESGRASLRWCWFEIVIARFAIRAVIGEEEFAATVEAKAGDVERGVGQQVVPGDFVAVVANAPDTAGRVIAIDVRAVQLR